jgi:hypothetical protein
LTNLKTPQKPINLPPKDAKQKDLKQKTASTKCHIAAISSQSTYLKKDI